MFSIRLASRTFIVFNRYLCCAEFDAVRSLSILSSIYVFNFWFLNW